MTSFASGVSGAMLRVQVHIGPRYEEFTAEPREVRKGAVLALPFGEIARRNLG